MRLNKLLFVPRNEPLLGMLDRFQEGRAHIAIVSRISVDKAASVKQAIKKGLTKRLKETIMGDSSSSTSDSSSDSESEEGHRRLKWGRKKSERKSESSSTLQRDTEHNGNSTLAPTSSAESSPLHDEPKHPRSKERKHVFSYRGRKKKKNHTEAVDKGDLELGDIDSERRRTKMVFPSPASLVKATALEQSTPADAVLTKAGAEEASVASADAPLY